MSPIQKTVRTARTSAPSVPTTSFERMMEKNNTLLELLLAQLEETNTKLADALKRIQELESQVKQPLPPKAAIQKVPSPLGSEASKYAKEPPATVVPPKQVSYASKAALPPVITPRPKKSVPIARAARLFSAPSPTSGYTFVYVAQKGRVPMNEIRKSLSSLGVNNQRILDIHFPTRNVCGLLVHNDYAQPLKDTFNTHGIKTMDEFDPLTPDIIRDPAFANATIIDRANKAHEIHRARVLRIVSRAPLRVRASLYRSFHDQGIIEVDTTVTNTPSPIILDSNKGNHTLFTEEDEKMMEVVPNSEAPIAN